MIFYDTSKKVFVFKLDSLEIPLCNSIKHSWSIHPRCSPSDYVSLGGNTLVVSNTCKLTKKYFNLGQKKLLTL